MHLGCIFWKKNIKKLPKTRFWHTCKQFLMVLVIVFYTFLIKKRPQSGFWHACKQFWMVFVITFYTILIKKWSKSRFWHTGKQFLMVLVIIFIHFGSKSDQNLGFGTHVSSFYWFWHSFLSQKWPKYISSTHLSIFWSSVHSSRRTSHLVRNTCCHI